MIGYMAQISMPEASTPSASAVLPLTTICGSVERSRRDAVAKIEIGLRPLVPGFEQHDVRIDHALVLLAEGEDDLIHRQLQLQAVDVAQHAQGEHVLAALRVGDQGAALPFHRDFAHLVARGHELVVGLDVGRDDLRIGVLAPHAFQQDDAAGL